MKEHDLLAFGKSCEIHTVMYNPSGAAKFGFSALLTAFLQKVPPGIASAHNHLVYCAASEWLNIKQQMLTLGEVLLDSSSGMGCFVPSTWINSRWNVNSSFGRFSTDLAKENP